MAYSPCPQCQTKEQFDTLFVNICSPSCISDLQCKPGRSDKHYHNSERKALDKAGFLFASRDSGGFVSFQCNKVAEHKYLTESAALTALHNAGYGK